MIARSKHVAEKIAAQINRQRPAWQAPVAVYRVKTGWIVR